MTVIRTRLLFTLFLTMLTCRAASAQVDLVGTWVGINNQEATDRGGGPRMVDYTGIPLNEEGRAKALSYSPNVYGQIERQCVHYNPSYTLIGPFGFPIQNEYDSAGNIVAIVIGSWVDKGPMAIWMDGRPHPPEWAPATWMGFSTGKWEGDILVVSTTHIKQEWIRRNGIPNSDRSTMIEHFIRHGSTLTHLVQWTDPVNLTEPLVRSEDFVLQERSAGSWLWPCEYVDEVVDRPRDEVPHYLPEKSPYAGDFAYRYGIPVEAAAGGAATMYPEYQERLRTLPRPPKPAGSK